MSKTEEQVAKLWSAFLIATKIGGNKMNEVYKINDIISCEFLKIPKAMFANEKYKKLSSDAKLAYALLYDRLSLSKLNNWINDDNEVYLIYTREELAEDLGLTYRKAISAFKELTEAELIREKRSGRGIPNKIYIVKIDLSAKQAKEFAKRENSRTAESAYLDEEDDFWMLREDAEKAAAKEQELQKPHIKNCENDISRTADIAHQELQNPHPNKTYNNKINNNQIYNSQSVSRRTPKCIEFDDGQTDDQYSFDEILDKCELDIFDDEERIILYDALERMFYSKNLKIGNAVIPQNKVRSRMYELDASVLQSAIANLHKNDRPVRNMTAYVMSTIFNCITEDYTVLHIDPYLNSIRTPARRE